MRFLITTDTVGGVWTFTAELAKQFLSDGHSVCMVSFGRAPSQEQLQLTVTLRQHNRQRFQYQAGEAKLEWMPDNTRAYADGSALLQTVARTHATDVLLSSQFCYGAVPLSCPKVVIAHSDVLSWADACSESLDMAGGWLQTYRAVVQRGLDAAHAVVAPTNSYLRALRKQFAIADQKSTVIANGRDVEAQITSNRTLQAVTAGRLWDKAKGIAQLTSIQSPLPILIAGQVTEPTSTRDNSVFIGQQTSEDLLALFRQSAIYICASLYEPFGLAPLEAAQCGCAIVARGIDTLHEIWGDAAFYFDSSEELKQILQLLTNDADLLRDMQARAIARARTYTAERMTQRYVELCRTLVSRGEVTHAA